MKTTRILNILVGAALSVSLSSSVFAAGASALQVSAFAAAAAGLLATSQPNSVAAFRADVIANPAAFQTPAQIVAWAGARGIQGITVAGIEANQINFDAAKATALKGVTVVDATSSSALLASVKGVDSAKCGLLQSAPVSDRETLKAGNAAFKNAIEGYVHTIQFVGGNAKELSAQMAGIAYSDPAVAKGAELVAKELNNIVSQNGQLPTADDLAKAASNAASGQGMPSNEATKLGEEIARTCAPAFVGQPA